MFLIKPGHLAAVKDLFYWQRVQILNIETDPKKNIEASNIVCYYEYRNETDTFLSGGIHRHGQENLGMPQYGKVSVQGVCHIAAPMFVRPTVVCCAQAGHPLFKGRKQLLLRSCILS